MSSARTAPTNHKPRARPRASERTGPIGGVESIFERRLRIVAPVLIALVAALLYAQTVRFSYVGFDDRHIILDRFSIIGDITKIGTAFTTNAFVEPRGLYYRPLQTATFMLDAVVGGRSATVYHVSNVIFHVLVCLTLYWLLVTLYVPRLYALFAGLIYAVHPLFVSTAAWLPARGDELLTLFTMVGFGAFVQYRRDPRTWYLLLHGGAYLLALFSKETAIGLPLLCLAYHYLDRKSLPSGSARALLLVWIPATALWAYFRSIPTTSPHASDFGLGAFVKNLPMLPEMVGKFFLPIRLSLIPHFRAADTAVGAVLVLAFLALAWWRGALTRTRFVFGALWFLIFLVPVMLYRNEDADYIFDYLYHRAYITHIGLLLCVIAMLPSQASWLRRPAGLVTGAALVAVLGIGALSLSKFYKDPIAFYDEAVARNPRSALAYNNRAAFYTESKRLDQAFADVNRALAIYPNYATALGTRAFIKRERYDYRGSLEDLTRALDIRPGSMETYFARGNLRALMRDWSGALTDYDTVLRSDAQYPHAYSMRAGALAMLGRGQEAIRDANEAIRIDPNDYEAYNGRGLAYRVLGQFDAAVQDFGTSIQKKSDYSRPYNNRGVVRFTQGAYIRAASDFDRAIRYDSLYAEAYSNRAMTWRELKQVDRAMADINHAIALNPDYPEALQNRGVLKNMKGRFGDALVDFDRSLQLAPQFADAYLGRGIAHFYRNERAQACADWSRAAVGGSRAAAGLFAQNCK